MNIRKFENYEAQDLHSRLNVIVAPNARGKTTLLESIGVVSSLASFKAHRLYEMIRSGQKQSSIVAEISEPSHSRVVIGLEEKRKSVKVDEKLISSKGKYPFLGASVSFVPDDLYLIKGGPDNRRRFLDDLALSLDPQFSVVLQRFEQSLKQRNKLLRSIKETGRTPADWEVWKEAFIQAAMPIYEGRMKTLSALHQEIPLIYQKLFGVSEITDLIYEHHLTACEGGLESAFRKRLESHEIAEKATGYALVGPQRDDIQFQILGLDARQYASQGQTRGLVIALKIAQLEMIQKERRWSPILLLDDIISELDDTRVEQLVDFLSNYPGQLFVTTAEVRKVESLHRQFSSFKVLSIDPPKIPYNSFKNSSEPSLSLL